MTVRPRFTQNLLGLILDTFNCCYECEKERNEEKTVRACAREHVDN
jgi:hypothetical protein